MMAQAQELRDRPHVVIATPGRMVDHLRSSSGEWDLSRVKFLVCIYVIDQGVYLITQHSGSRRGRSTSYTLLCPGTFSSVWCSSKRPTDQSVYCHINASD